MKHLLAKKVGELAGRARELGNENAFTVLNVLYAALLTGCEEELAEAAKDCMLRVAFDKENNG